MYRLEETIDATAVPVIDTAVAVPPTDHDAVPVTDATAAVPLTVHAASPDAVVDIGPVGVEMDPAGALSQEAAAAIQDDDPQSQEATLNEFQSEEAALEEAQPNDNPLDDFGSHHWDEDYLFHYGNGVGDEVGSDLGFLGAEAKLRDEPSPIVPQIDPQDYELDGIDRKSVV